MPTLFSHGLTRFLFAAACLICAGLANAQPLTIDVPYAAGGPSDALVRRLAAQMGGTMVGTVAVENVMGANGLVALRRFVQRDKTVPAVVFVASPTFLAAATNEPQLLDSLRPVALVGLSPLVIAGRNGSGSFNDALAKPMISAGALKIGISAPGSISHLCAAQLAEALGVPLKATVYKGVAPMTADLLSGTLEHACVDMASVGPYVRAGKLKALATTGTEAVADLGNAPTLESLKIGGLTHGLWYAIMARDGAPAEFVDLVSQAIKAALASEFASGQSRESGLVLVPAQAATAEAATAFIRREHGRMTPFLPIFTQ